MKHSEKSHLLQMRGLKPASVKVGTIFSWSHLLQMRGLKPFEKIYIGCSTVASFTDAWIETRKDEILSNPSLSHLLQMRGLKQQ